MAGVVAATAAVAVSADVVVTPWSHGRPATAAYAVTKQGDAVSVAVRWYELRDPAALNAELARLGARTVVMRLSADGQCRTGFAIDQAHSVFRVPPRGLRDPAKIRKYTYGGVLWLDPGIGLKDGAVFRIHPDKIPIGETLLVPYHFSSPEPANSPVLLQFFFVPKVPACVPSPADTIYTGTGIEVR